MTTSIIAQDMLTMNSREIAELTGKDHAHVMRDCRMMFQDLEISQSSFGSSYLAGNGKQEPMFLLPKALTLTLVSGYSTVMRKRIIDRWLELEAAQQPVGIPTSFSAALRLAAEQQETIEQQKAKLEAAAPAVEFVKKYVDSTALKSFRQVCKLLNAKENDFRAFLMARNIMYRLGGEWVPYACHIDAGRFVVKAGTSDSGHAFNSARFTSKGVEWVAGEFARFQVRELEVAA